jgi:CHAT domain-containing protein
LIRSALFFAAALAAQVQEPERLLQFAQSDLDSGRYGAAIETARRAAEGFRKLGNRRDGARAQTTAGLAELYLGDYTRAVLDLEASLQEAIEIHDFANEVGRLNDIGSAFYFQGLYSDAMTRYQRALQRVEATPSDRWSGWARQITLSNIAILYQTLGQSERALSLYTSLLGGLQTLPPRERAQFLMNIGVLRRRLGDPGKALETYRAAQALYRQSAHRDGEIAVLNAIGIVQAMDFRNWSAAEAAFTEALDLAERSRNRPLAVHARLYRGETFFRAGRLRESSADFAAAATHAHELGGQEEEWRACYGLARLAASAADRAQSTALLLRTVDLIEALRQKAGAPSGLSSFLADKRAVYDLLVENSSTASDAFRWMEASRARVLRDRRKLAGAKSLQDVASALPPDTAILEFWLGDKSGAAIWITSKQSFIQRWPLTAGTRASIERLALVLSDARRTEWRDAANAVSGSFLQQIPRSGNAAVKHLIVIPDGALARIPFEALPLPDGTLLIQRYTVAYSAAAALLATHPHEPPRFRWPWQLVLAGFADPAPGATESDGIVAARQWPRLPEAVREVTTIARLSGAKSTLHFGKDARKEALAARTDLPALHLATHGFADMQNPGLSYLLLAPSAPSRQFDYLFLKEVHGLPLDGVGLVTLSACETEAGRFTPGEGVESFSQAFLSAGARTTVTSLWRVNDKPAAEFMIRLYGNLWSGQRVDEALREAKLAFLNQTSAAHPAYWSAFVVYGEGGLQLPRVVRWSWIVLTASVLAGAAAILSARRRRRRLDLEQR